MRRFRRHGSDSNQPEIVEGLRADGHGVVAIGEPVDLLVGVAGAGVNLLLEVKRDAKAKLTPAQEKFFATWPGQKARVNSLAEARAAVTSARDGASRVRVD